MIFLWVTMEQLIASIYCMTVKPVGPVMKGFNRQDWASIDIYIMYNIKEELNPKIKFVLFERTLKQSKLSFSFWFPCFVFEIFQFLWYANYTWRSIRAMTYQRMLYIFAIIKQNHFKMYMFGVVGETHAHDYFEVISFYNSKDI